MELVPVHISVERNTERGAVGSTAQLSRDICLRPLERLTCFQQKRASRVAESSLLIKHLYSCVDRKSSFLRSCSASILNVGCRLLSECLENSLDPSLNLTLFHYALRTSGPRHGPCSRHLKIHRTLHAQIITIAWGIIALAWLKKRWIERNKIKKR